jgi:murein DD-endopeptidase MepM/ murein hydrolase activator NlpD
MSKRKASWWFSFFLIAIVSFAFCSSNGLSKPQADSSTELNRGFEKAKILVSSLDEVKNISVSALELLAGNSLKGYASPDDSSRVLASLTNYDYQQQMSSYQVKEGDTLAALAVQFGVSVETLSWANDLSLSAVLRPGQKLNILPVSGVLYLVRSGDTLGQIAQSHQAKVNEILTFNDLDDAEILSTGDLLIIPNGQKPEKASVLIPTNSYYFIRPTTGYISQGLHPFNAIDVANRCGTLIYAAAGGIVQKVGYITIGGNRVRILHPNGVVTYYGHLSKFFVSPGQRVVVGQEIGLMGETGNATGCHLHFDVRGGTNPLAKYPVGTVLRYR